MERPNLLNLVLVYVEIENTFSWHRIPDNAWLTKIWSLCRLRI